MLNSQTTAEATRELLPQAVPVKINNGEWGARTDRLVHEGERIAIRARNGRAWTARVGRIVFRGHGYALVETE